MKNLRLLLLPMVGFLLFMAGIFLLPSNSVFPYSLIGCGALLTLLFYFITISHVNKTMPGYSSRKIFWLIVIICVPVIGNIIYIIFIETANRKQTSPVIQ